MDDENINLDSEVNLYQVLYVFLFRWKYLLIFALIFSLGAIVKHKFFPIYPSRGRLIIKDLSESSAYSVFNSFISNTSRGMLSKENRQNRKAIIKLSTNDYFIFLAGKLNEKIKDPSSRYKSKAIILNYLKDKSLQKLADDIRLKISFIPDSNGQIIVKGKTKYTLLSMFLVNVTLESSKEWLTNDEIKDFNNAEEFLSTELIKVEKKLEQIESETIYSMKDNELISLEDLKRETSGYLNELRSNINDVKMKMAENKIILKSLSADIKEKRDSLSGLNKFGVNSRIQSLVNENKLLEIKLTNFKLHQKKIRGKGQHLLPYQNKMNKMKSNYVFEYNYYKELKDKIVKIGIQKTYAQNRVKVLERERVERIHSYPGLLMMVLIAVIISQIIAFATIYFYEIFKPTFSKC